MDLKTDRLTLRTAALTDLADLNAIMRDPRAMAYWSTPPHPDLQTTEMQLARMISRSGPPCYFMFETHDTPNSPARVIGMGGMHGHNEIGYILHPDFWRQGYVREAMTRILQHIWDTTTRRFVHADTDPRNQASIGLLKDLGFHETHQAEKTYCVDGVWSDSLYFKLFRPTE